MKKNPIAELGVLARQREIAVLQIIRDFGDQDEDYEINGREKGDTPLFEIEQHSRKLPVCEESQPSNIPFFYTAYSIISDLIKYGLAEAKWDDGWTVAKITEKGRKLLEHYE